VIHTKRHSRFLIGLLLAACLAALPILTYPLYVDQALFWLGGRAIVNGMSPYLGFWDLKPLAVYYTYALPAGLFPAQPSLLFIVSFLVGLPSAVGLHWLGRRLFSPPAGLWAALVFLMVYFRSSYDVLAQSDELSLPFMVFALVAAYKAGDAAPSSRAALAYALLSGALCGICFWYKYPFVLFAIAPVTLHVLRRWRAARPALLAEGAAFAGGGLLALAAGIGVLLATGAYANWLDILNVTASYASNTGTPIENTALIVERGLLNAVKWAPALLCVLLVPLFSAWKSWRAQAGLLLLWAAPLVFVVWLQGKGFFYHWTPLLGVVALAAGFGLDRAVAFVQARVLRGRFAIVPIILITAAFFGLLISRTWLGSWRYLAGQETQQAYFSRFAFGSVQNAGVSYEVAEYVRAATSQDDSLFVWAFDPAVYVYSQRALAAPQWLHLQPLVASWSLTEWQSDALASLQARLPAYIVIRTDDGSMQLNGVPDDSLTLLYHENDLTDWIRAHYAEETRIADFRVWRYTGGN
jgi:4-amino-4-deoxy-L-arabinose transferase-like glycosyltransferase